MKPIPTKQFVMSAAQMNEVFPPTPEINVKKKVVPIQKAIHSMAQKSMLEQYLSEGNLELKSKLKGVENYSKKLESLNVDMVKQCNKLEADILALKDKYRNILKLNDENCAKLTNSIMVNSNLTREVYQQNKAFRDVMDENTQLHAKLKKQTIIYIE